MKNITSTSNPRVKELLRLRERKTREQLGCFLVEGYHLVEEAKRAGMLEEVWITDPSDDKYGVETTLVTREVIQKISSTKEPQPILAVCKKKDHLGLVGDKILLLDDVSDPGNLGTLIRSAAAFGVTTIVLSPNTVDCFNDKVIRSTQGALFFRNIVVMDIKDAIVLAKDRGLTVIGTSLAKSKDVSALNPVTRYALLLGNEARGVNPDYLSLCDLRVRLDMTQAVESLNVAVAGSILLFYLNQVEKTIH